MVEVDDFRAFFQIAHVKFHIPNIWKVHVFQFWGCSIIISPGGLLTKQHPSRNFQSWPTRGAPRWNGLLGDVSWGWNIGFHGVFFLVRYWIPHEFWAKKSNTKPCCRLGKGLVATTVGIEVHHFEESWPTADGFRTSRATAFVRRKSRFEC